ncbi:DUF3324 domain-containing protein [Enterococcus villorum]|uniref:DUF3324 domain-containing protein n=1 Tax=Enterococcus villorum TaxID=112904 RepID=UPI001F4E3B74|nr:DUF3324 domain-containing protein [Enterococcus villorum]
MKLPEKLNAGDYQLVLKVKHKKDKWVFKKAIHLSSQTSKEIRQRALGKDNIRVFYGLLILSAVCIYLLLFLFLKKEKRSTAINIKNLNSTIKQSVPNNKNL